MEERATGTGRIVVRLRVGEQPRPRVGIRRWIVAVGREHRGRVLDKHDDRDGVGGALADAPTVLGPREPRQDERSPPLEGGLEREEQCVWLPPDPEGRRSGGERRRWRGNRWQRTRRRAMTSGCAESGPSRRRRVVVRLVGRSRWVVLGACHMRASIVAQERAKDVSREPSKGCLEGPRPAPAGGMGDNGGNGSKDRKRRRWRQAGSVSLLPSDELLFEESIGIPLDGDPCHTKTSDGDWQDAIDGRPILLIGTFNKISEYTRGMFRDLHRRFRSMLRELDQLVVCGYGFGDKGINSSAGTTRGARDASWLFILIATRWSQMPGKPLDENSAIGNVGNSVTFIEKAPRGSRSR